MLFGIGKTTKVITGVIKDVPCCDTDCIVCFSHYQASSSAAHPAASLSAFLPEKNSILFTFHYLAWNLSLSYFFSFSRDRER